MYIQVIQVYVEWTNKSLPAPHRQLVGFERVFIPVGQGVTAHFEVTLEQIAVWNDQPPSFVTLRGTKNTLLNWSLK
jgi:Fibronectin type III-like domain